MARRTGDNEKKQIIVRREEVVSGGHHGGSWKIAYADFVTAMMAFFLVMWLINATSEQQKRGIASFFNPMAESHEVQAPAGGVVSSRISPLVDGTELKDPKADAADSQTDTHGNRKAAASGGPDGVERASGAGNDMAGDGADPSTLGRKALHLGAEDRSLGPVVDAAPELPRIVPIGGASGPAWSSAKHGDPGAGTREEQSLQDTASRIRDLVAHASVPPDAARNLSIAVTPEGLRIELSDAEVRPMFDLGASRVNERGRALLRLIAPYVAQLPERVTITGHTDAAPYQVGHLSNWTLSSLRADSARDILVTDGLAEQKIDAVTGRADRDLAKPADPLNAANRRIVLLVRRTYAPSARQ